MPEADWAKKLLAARAASSTPPVTPQVTKENSNAPETPRAIPQHNVSNDNHSIDSDDVILSRPVSNNSSAAPGQYEIIHERILSLSSALLSQHPSIPVLLQEIRRKLKNDPALVTLLQPTDIATIVRGLEKQTNTYLAESITKPSTAAKAKLKNATANDFGF